MKKDKSAVEAATKAYQNSEDAYVDTMMRELGLTSDLDDAYDEDAYERKAIDENVDRSPKNKSPKKKATESNNDYPSPAGLAEGSKLKDDAGNIVATIKDGAWLTQ